MWKQQKCASMSWQRRRMALSASNNVARTWKRFSVTWEWEWYVVILAISLAVWWCRGMYGASEVGVLSQVQEKAL